MTERSGEHAVEFLALSTAAAIVYHQVTGRALASTRVAHSNAILEEVARALAEAAPIYVLDDATGSFTQLDPVDLAPGRVSTRRVMRAAVEAFRRAGRTF